MRHTFAPLESNRKRMKNASGKRPPDEAHGPGKRSYQTAAARPGEGAKRGCTLARCSNSGSRDCADSKDKACDARHGARVVQIARCSASTSKNCKISFLSCFEMPVNFPFFKYLVTSMNKTAEHAKDHKDESH